MTPYFPSLGTMRRWMESRLGGHSSGGAWLHAEEGMRPRDLARTLVAGAHGQPPLLLSVAIEGGASRVKRGEPEKWRLSDHGRWRDMHLGAIEAAYGATPFFPHLFPLIEEIFAGIPAGAPFSLLTERLHDACMGLLDPETLIPVLRRPEMRLSATLAAVAGEKNQDVNDDLAFIDVIFRKGPESIFSLIDFTGF